MGLQCGFLVIFQSCSVVAARTTDLQIEQIAQPKTLHGGGGKAGALPLAPR